MTTQEQERAVISKSFEGMIDGIYGNFVNAYAGAANDPERESAKATFKDQITKARELRDIAFALIPG